MSLMVLISQLGPGVWVWTALSWCRMSLMVLISQLGPGVGVWTALSWYRMSLMVLISQLGLACGCGLLCLGVEMYCSIFV